MRKFVWVIIGIACLAPLAVYAVPQRGQRTESAPVFSDSERRIILDYYRADTRNLPPGLAKRQGNLPPGLEKQLQRNGRLPPGLDKRITSFPADLDRRLPRLPTIWRRGTIGSQAIIYDTRTRAILDIIDIIRRR